MKQDEFEWLQRIEQNIDAAWDDLTDFERQFIEKLLERFRQYGIRTLISPKEWAIISQISDKVIP